MSRTLCLTLACLAAVLLAGTALAEGTVELTGSVLCAESGAPLHTGTISANGKATPITNGQFQLELQPGDYSLTVTGAYRKPKTFAVKVGAQAEPLHIALEPQFSQEEIDLLARITRAEAEGESRLGQIAVAATVLNRTQSPRYPDTIAGVVYQKVSGRYQYSPVADGRINLPPTGAHYEAAFQALAGLDPTSGATGFFNPAKTADRWVRSHPVTTVIGNHRFFRY